MIKKTDHCLLCEHQQNNFMSGVYCGITQKKPEFDKTCDSIKFDKVLEEKILENNIELKLVELTKVDTIGHFIIFLSIGIACLFFGIFLVDTYWLKFMEDPYIHGRYSLAVMIVILTIGVGIIIFATAPVNLYLRKYKIAKLKKKKLDDILKVYNLTYNINLSIQKKWPNTFEVTKDLKIYTIAKKGKHIS